jgi:hypothetical protein
VVQEVPGLQLDPSLYHADTPQEAPCWPAAYAQEPRSTLGATAGSQKEIADPRPSCARYYAAAQRRRPQAVPATVWLRFRATSRAGLTTRLDNRSQRNPTSQRDPPCPPATVLGLPTGRLKISHSAPQVTAVFAERATTRTATTATATGCRLTELDIHS